MIDEGERKYRKEWLTQKRQIESQISGTERRNQRLILLNELIKELEEE